MAAERTTYLVRVAGLERVLPLHEVAPAVRIAVVNILGDVELVEACAEALAPCLAESDPDVVVTAEAKSIPLAHAVARRLELPYVVLRKTYKPYMGVTLSAETHSITTGTPQTLHLDEKDHDAVRDRRVVLLDDVISTGSTLNGMERLVERAGGEITARAAIFTEGDPSDWPHVVALGHLPVFMD